MRVAAFLALAVVTVACTKAEAPPVIDTTAAVTAAPAAPMSLASLAGTWDVKVMPEGRDTVVSTYTLNTTDSANWTLTFPGRQPIPMQIVGRSGDSLMTTAGPFESSVRADKAQTTVNTTTWVENGVMKGKVMAHYAGVKTADSVVALRSEGTKK